jgi:hypothetical protein
LTGNFSRNPSSITTHLSSFLGRPPLSSSGSLAGKIYLHVHNASDFNPSNLVVRVTDVLALLQTPPEDHG